MEQNKKIGAGGEPQNFDIKTGKYLPDNNTKNSVDFLVNKSVDELKELAKQNSISLKSGNSRTLSKEDFYGKEIPLKKGENPVDVLLKHKEGHIKNAFYRREMGYIDLVWGTNGKKGGGLWHLIERRDESFQSGKGKISGIDMARKIPEILDKGSLVEDNQNRFNFEYQDYRVGVKPAYDGEKVNWIVSAMEIF